MKHSSLLHQLINDASKGLKRLSPVVNVMKELVFFVADAATK
jgi:hypothetical protein